MYVFENRLWAITWNLNEIVEYVFGMDTKNVFKLLKLYVDAALMTKTDI